MGNDRATCLRCWSHLNEEGETYVCKKCGNKYMLLGVIFDMGTRKVFTLVKYTKE